MMKALSDCHVLVTPTSFGKNDMNLKTQLESLVGHVTYNTTGKPFDAQTLSELIIDVDGYIAGLDTIDATVLAHAKHLRVIARYGTGVSNVDLDAAKAHAVTVTNTPAANAKSVAELTIALILNLIRPIIVASQDTRNGGWMRTDGFSMEGKTVGLIGLGAIGRETARKLQGFDCHVMAYDVAPNIKFADSLNIEIVTSIQPLLKQADFVSLHVPLSPNTFEMVNANFLSQMKQGAYVINTARGGLVDEKALYESIQNEHLAGAALDVFCEEPPSRENPLLQLPQVITTPHMGAHTDGATNTMGWMAVESCLAVLRGEDPPYRVV
ncbi:MAG: phosphoglycerate dehydrogenase [Aggregatilineales bacterium]